jgi:hypothetical protein
MRNIAIAGIAAAGILIAGCGSAHTAGSAGQRPLPAIPSASGTPYTNPATPAAAPSPTGPPVATVGQTLTATQDGQDAASITVLRVEESTQPVDQYSDGPAKGYFVSVLIRYRAKNAFSGGFDVSPLDWYAKVGSAHFDEGDGNAYEGPHGMNGELDSPTLGAGETTTGWVLFDVPSAHGKIAYAPNFDGGALGFWRF